MIFSTDALIEDIWASIVGATFVVADLTTKNANVLYEVGMAHTVGRPVVIITQDMGDIPFDLQHRRCIVYQHTPRGCEQLEQQLAEPPDSFLTGQTAQEIRLTSRLAHIRLLGGAHPVPPAEHKKNLAARIEGEPISMGG